MAPRNSRSVQSYQSNSLLHGWTRVEMLIAVYDRAIEMTSAAQTAMASGKNATFWEKLLHAQKCVIALHSGLKPEESEIAFNVGRLLHYVMTQLCEHRFEEALRILQSLRDSFAAIREEANELERAGAIPPVDVTQDSLAVV